MMDIEQIATIAVEEYDKGVLKPAMAKQIAARTLIEDSTATLLVETIDAYVDKHESKDCPTVTPETIENEPNYHHTCKPRPSQGEEFAKMEGLYGHLEREIPDSPLVSACLVACLRDPTLREGGFTQRNIREIASLRLEQLERKLSAIEEAVNG